MMNRSIKMRANESCVFNGRVVVVGDASVGKTSILNQLVDHRYDPYEQSTVGANYQLFINEVNDVRVEIQIWDTAGQEKFRSLGPIYFRNSIGAIVVYDVTNRTSYDNLDSWITNFTEVAGTEAVIAIVGNKNDLEDERQIQYSEAQEWAHTRNYLFFETSAKTGHNIALLFDEFTKSLVDAKINTKQTAKHGYEVTNNSSGGCC